MAIMHPEDIENYKHTGSELKLYNELKTQLPDKDHVFFSVRWFDKVDGQRIDSECDFLVFDPGFGFLTIECKGGQDLLIDNNHWSLVERNDKGEVSTRELKRSPFAQAESSMRYFYDYFQNEFLQTFNGVYGFAVALPFYSIEQKLESAADQSLIIDIRHMSDLAHRINEIFHYWKGKRNNRVPFSADQKQRFITLVNKRISISAAAGALIPIKNKEFEKINLVQDSIIDFLANYPQVQIVGGAGTGKTFMAIKKICRELALQHSVLYICRNRALSRFVECQCNNHRNLKSYNFDDYLDELLGTKDKRSDKSIFDLIDEIKHDYYDAIIVDEAQDFSLDEALAIRLFLRNEKESCLYVFYDKNQNLFDLNFEDVFGIDAKPYILRYNIRNTGEIYNYATRTTGLGYETQANQLLGVVPEIKKYKSRMQALTIVSQILNRLIQKEYVNTESIVILSDQLYEDSLFSGEKKIGEYDVRLNINDSRENSILFASVSEFKGLEADIIIYLKNNGDAEKDGALRNRENYVACTRARYYLYVLEKN